MNRSILIVICDFLLVSLLVFSTPDISRVGQKSLEESAPLTVKTNRVDVGQDLTAVMKQALEEEHKTQEELLARLAATRETAEHRQAQLTERQKQLEATQQQLKTRSQEASRLQQEQQAVQQQYTIAQKNIQNLNSQLQASANESLISQEKLSAAEAELRRRAQEAAALQQRLSRLSESNRVVLNEKQQLATKLQVAEVEKRHATEQVATMREQVQTERAEKAKLAEGFKTLASSSGQLAQEIRQNRPLAANTIFNDFLTNRVRMELSGVRPGVFGDAGKSREANTILIANGTNTYALCHVEDTLFTFWDPGTDWKGLTGQLAHDGEQVPIQSLSFDFRDPRIVFIPVSRAELRSLDCKVYRIDSDPFRFEDAVLVGASEGYYGECRFEIDPDTPGYLKLDRSVLKGIFGKFNPSRGDLVFSRTGGLLGIMANNTYCMRLQNLEPSATFEFGQTLPGQHTGETLSAFYYSVSRMDSRLR